MLVSSRALVRLAVAAALPVALGAGATGAAAGAPPKVSTTAEIVYPVAARSAPSAKAKKVAPLVHYTEFTRRPNVLMVTSTRKDETGEVSWVQVLIPGRPNGRRGWVPADAVVMGETPYRVRVKVRSRTLEILRNGRVISKTKAAVGTGGTPTPLGRWAVRDVYTDRSHFLGPSIIVLTANSTVLRTFAGGQGEVAIHGWPDASVMGRAVSHGCVRLTRDAVAALAKFAKAGTPVDVVNA